MEYDVYRIEFVKSLIKKTIQMSKHIFQICIGWIVLDDIFLKVISYILTCYMKCFICFVTLHSHGSNVFVSHSHWCVYIQIQWISTNELLAKV